MTKTERFALTLATATLNLILVWEVAARPSHCRKDCKQDSKSCLALVPPNKDCTGTKAEKKACRKMHAAQRKTCRSLAKLCKQENPNMSGACLPGCGRFLTTWGSSGNGDGQFDGPFGVAVDGSGNVFVVDDGNNRIQKFTNTGAFLTTWGSSGSGDGQFIMPLFVAVEGSGNVFVADNNNNRIQKFACP